MRKVVKKGVVKSVVVGVALLGMAACSNSSYWYPQESRGPTGNSCCYAYDEYPPYTSSYYEPATPYGFSIGPHQHIGFSGTVRPGYREGVNNWDGTGRMHYENEAWESDDQKYQEQEEMHRSWHRHHHHRKAMQQGGGNAPERTQGAGQNNSYGRDNTGERPQ